MADQDELLTIATFPTAVEAELAKSHLESEGIACALGNELASGLMPFLGAGLGGISLQVASQDAVRAREVLGLPVT